jgi:hypothetical protein
MALFHRLRVWLVAVGLIHLALPGRAAELDRKYLLDDAHLVVTVNVQKALDSTAYKKQFQQQAEGLLKAAVVKAAIESTPRVMVNSWGSLLEAAVVQAAIKDFGFDPLKDIERITLVMGLSCYMDEPRMEDGEITGLDSEAGPLIIVQGRFDAAKLEAGAKELFKDLKIHEVGTHKVYEVADEVKSGGIPRFAAIADPKTVVFGRFKKQVADALDKAAGKKKTQIKNKVMAGLLDKLDADQVVAAAVSGDMVAGSSTSVSNANGQVVAAVQHKILKEETGIDALLIALRVADDVKGEVTISVADADKAKAMAQSIELGVQTQIDRLKALIENPNQRIPAKTLAPGLNLLKAVKVTAKDSTVVLQTQISAQVAANFVQSYFVLRNPPPAAAPIPEPCP